MPIYSVLWNDEVPVLCAPRFTASAAVHLAEALLNDHRPEVVVQEIFTRKIIPIDELRKQAAEEEVKIAPRP